MTTETNERSCQWKGCTDQASKHLTYSVEPQAQVIESNDRGVRLSMQIYHADLCAPHLSQTQDRYGGYVLELDEACSPDCPRSKWK